MRPRNWQILLFDLLIRTGISIKPFLVSYYICITLQAVLFLTIRPFSKRLYRQINVFLAELLWLQLIWLVDWWAGIKVCIILEQKVNHLFFFIHHLHIKSEVKSKCKYSYDPSFGLQGLSCLSFKLVHG